MSQATNHVRRLLPRHFKVLELTLAGHDVKTIAQATEMSTSSVSLLQRSPLFQLELTKARRESSVTDIATLDRQAHVAKAQSILADASDRAASTLVDLLDNPDPSIQLRGAEKILDRVFSHSNGGAGVVINISTEQVQLLQLALKESAYVSGKQPANRSDAECTESGWPELCQAGGLDAGPADGQDAERPAERSSDVHSGSDEGQGNERLQQEDVSR